MAKARSTTSKPRAKAKSKPKPKPKPRVTAKPKPKAEPKVNPAKGQSLKIALPGRIYQRGTRWWWCTELPGDDKPKARPLKAKGDKAATEDRKQAEEIAFEMWEQAVRDIAQRQVRSDAEQKVARLKAQFLEKIRDFTQVIERTTAKLEAEKQARIEAEAKLQGLPAVQLSPATVEAEPEPQNIVNEPEPVETSVEPEPQDMALTPVQTASCQCCDTGEIPITDLTQIDSGQFLCPDCLAALRMEVQFIEPPERVECRMK